jgi:hypothetical protein
LVAHQEMHRHANASSVDAWNDRFWFKTEITHPVVLVEKQR